MEDDKSYVRYLASLSHDELSTILDKFSPERRARIIGMIDDLHAGKGETVRRDGPKDLQQGTDCEDESARWQAMLDSSDGKSVRHSRRRSGGWRKFLVVVGILAVGYAVVAAVVAATTPVGQPVVAGAIQSAKKTFIPDWAALNRREKAHVGFVKACSDLLCEGTEGGSAFQVPSGWWFTANHVIQGTYWNAYLYRNGSQQELYKDSSWPSYDVWLAYTEGINGSGALPLGANSDITTGEAVEVIGHPNLDPAVETASGRIVGGIDHHSIHGDGNVLTYTVLVTSQNNVVGGDSGAVVISGHGYVIGMVIGGGLGGRDILAVPPSSLSYAMTHCHTCKR